MSIFLVYTADLKVEKVSSDNTSLKSVEALRESKYLGGIEFWRIYTNAFQVLIDIQIAKNELSELVLKVTYFCKYCKS